MRVVLDLVTVRFIQSYLARPMQIFGMAGFVCFAAGAVLSAWLAFHRIVYGTPLAERPALLLGVLLIVVGIQLASLGLVADVLARTYFESQKNPSYYVRQVVRGPARQPGASGELAGATERAEQLQ
jgi:hypothetical protein